MQLSHLPCLLFVLLSLLSVALSATLSFNSTSCSQGCSLTDPNIWVPQQTPTSEDSLFILTDDPVLLQTPQEATVHGLVVTGASISIVVGSDSTFTTTALQVVSGTVRIQGKAIVQLALTFSNESTFELESGASLQSTSCEFNGVAKAAQNSHFVCTEVTLSTKLADFQSPMYFYNTNITGGSTIKFPAGYIGNSLFVLNASTVTVSTQFISKIQVDSTSILNLTNLQPNSSVNGYIGTGKGSVYVYSDNLLTFNGKSGLMYYATIYIGGTVNVFFDTCSLDSDGIKFVNSSSFNIVNIAASNLDILYLHVPGNLTVYGKITFYQATIEGTLFMRNASLPGNYILKVKNIEVIDSYLALNREFEAKGYVHVHKNSSMAISTNGASATVTIPNLINEGRFYTLLGTLKGNYEQTSTGTFSYYDLEVNSGYAPFKITGNAKLAGNLQYRVENAIPYGLRKKYHAIRVEGEISGKFRKIKSMEGAKDYKFKLSYGSHDVFMVYDRMWILAVVLAVVGTVGVGTVLFILRKRLTAWIKSKASKSEAYATQSENDFKEALVAE